MTDGAMMTLLGFAAVLVAIVSGLMTIKKIIRETSTEIALGQVSLEHRLTVLETNVQWLKDHVATTAPYAPINEGHFGERQLRRQSDQRVNVEG